MRTVRLSLKSARAWLAFFETKSLDVRALNELQHAIAHAERASATRRKLAKPKAEKRKAKREATSAVYEAVAARAGGFCECGCGRAFGPEWWARPELDHFEGRARSESVETCWLLRNECHRQKTESRPSATSWLGRFIAHARRYGYSQAMERARGRLGFVSAKEHLSGKAVAL